MSHTISGFHDQFQEDAAVPLGHDLADTSRHVHSEPMSSFQVVTVATRTRTRCEGKLRTLNLHYIIVSQ